MFSESLHIMLSLEGECALEEVILVVPDGWEARAAELVLMFWRPVRIIVGGQTRQESVRLALASVPEDADLVLVHDAARPRTTLNLFSNVIKAATESDGAIAAVAIRDTVKRVEGGSVKDTISRDGLWLAQTPQAFRRAVLQRAHNEAVRRGLSATDDAQLVEMIGGQITAVPGEVDNIKITTAADMWHAHWLSWAGAASVGVGYDAHELVEGRPLVLGGVTIPFEKGLTGHSDADVLCHAIADAAIGAAGAGDLGRHFPSHDERWRGVGGLEILKHVRHLLEERGLRAIGVDATVAIERPSLADLKGQMEKEISSALGGRTNVKATTTDRLGIVGEGKGAAASAVVVVTRRDVGMSLRRPPPPDP